MKTFFPFEYELDQNQIRSATAIGRIRYRDMLESGRPQTHGEPEDGSSEANYVLGAIAEKGVSMALNLRWWDYLVEYAKIPDVGDFTQVRLTKRADGGLLVHLSDVANFEHCPFILTFVSKNVVKALGWKWGGECNTAMAGERARRLLPRSEGRLLVPQRELHRHTPPEGRL